VIDDLEGDPPLSAHIGIWIPSDTGDDQGSTAACGRIRILLELTDTAVKLFVV
jgi:hypothetical protein